MTEGPRRGFTTAAVHAQPAGPAASIHQQPSSVPIYQTSTWRCDTLDEFAEVIADGSQGYVYGRGYGNPTVETFEATMAELEQTETAMAFDSGMAAIHGVVTALARSGQRVVSSRYVYGGTYSLFVNLLPRYGITTTFVDPGDLDAVAAALPGAALFYAETISNPRLAVADVPALAGLCRDAGVPTVIDNTIASPYLCNPAEHGFDYVVHSATKYIGGHSDLVGGVVCTSAERRAALRELAIDTGGAMQPLEAWLGQRGLTTLALRMERHCATAAALAGLLAEADEIAAVYYPGLETDPSYEVARSLLGTLSGGMVTIDHRDGYAGATRFCEALELAWIGASLGGPHTLIAHPASTTHRQVEPARRAAAGLTDGLIRISVGLEDEADVLDDFAGALKASS